jgi:hypothetical protein
MVRTEIVKRLVSANQVLTSLLTSNGDGFQSTSTLRKLIADTELMEYSAEKLLSKTILIGGLKRQHHMWTCQKKP